MINPKYSQLIATCIKHGASEDGKITKTKLAKLVFLSDFAYYFYNYEPITGLDYKKISFGPVPTEYFRTLDEMIENELVVLEVKGCSQLYSLIQEPETSLLNEDELALIKKVCLKWLPYSTNTIVDFTHGKDNITTHKQNTWNLAFDNETVPYSLIIQETEDNVY